MADSPENQNPTRRERAKEVWRNGNSLFQKGKMEEAHKAYTDALLIDDQYTDAYFNRALVDRINGDVPSAKKDLEKVMELQPDSADAPLLMGDIIESTEDYLGARYWYEKSLANKPDYDEAKKRIEHVDSILHIDTTTAAPAPDLYNSSGQKQMQPSTPQSQKLKDLKKPEETDVIEEGQIKKVAFYKSKIKFDSVIGMSKVKKYLHDNVVLAIERPDLFRKYGKKLGTGLLLYGPPGTGKTHIARAIAGEAESNFIVARINQIIDMYTGNTEKNLHAIFDQARKNAPAIIFFDELDALGVKRGGGGEGGESSALRLAVNQFLVEMNGLEDNPEGIFVIGATNNPWDIDPALKRSGRFGDTLYIPPPNYKDRKMLMMFYTRNKPHASLNYGRLARATTGFSPADIERVCDKAAMIPLIHEFKSKTSRRLTMNDFMLVLKDKDMSSSSLDEWYSMVKKDIISKTETNIVDGKKQEIVKEGKLDAQEKVTYKVMVKDIKKNTSPFQIKTKKFIKWFALNVF
jgi:transitional endoplasmic reticulum ATPase